MMLQSVLVLHAREGRIEDLVAEYRATGIIEAALPFGLLRGEALVHGDDLIVTSLWRDPAAYNEWLASDERVRVTANLPGLLDPERDPEILKMPREGEPAPESDLPLDGVVESPVERVITVVAE